jgi:hypothetical protein
MTRFLQPDEAAIDTAAESRTKRGRDRVACFLHLRDLVYLHPKAASADAIALVQSLEAAVMAQKGKREKRLAEVHGRAEGWLEAGRVKAAAGSADARSRRRSHPAGPPAPRANRRARRRPGLDPPWSAPARHADLRMGSVGRRG